MSGEFSLTDEAWEKADEFHLVEAHKTALQGSRFEDYNERRSLMLLKLSQIYSAAESQSLEITTSHIDKALDIMLRTEKEMPRVFNNLVSSRGFSTTVEELIQSSDRTHISHQEVEQMLRKRHRPSEIREILRSMIMSGELVPEGTRAGLPIYKIVSEKRGS
jgi:hypothetical protein